MKIALVIENFNPAAGGNERSTQQIAKRLAAQGHDVTIITNSAPTHSKSLSPQPDDTTESTTPNSPPPGHIRILTADGPKTRSAYGLWRFRRFAINELSSGPYDVSLSMTLAVPATALQPRGGTVRETLRQNIAMRKGFLPQLIKRIAILLTPKQLALLYFESKTLRAQRVRRVIAISQYVADQLFKHYTLSKRRIVHIPNAAEVQFFSPPLRERKRNLTRETFGLAPTDTVFLFVAMNPRLKGYDPLLIAFKNALTTNPNLKLIVAGTTDPKHQQQAEQLNLTPNIRFVGKTSEMDALYLAADTLIHPTYYDPSSKVVLEALLHARPAITTRYNGAAQWVYDPHGQSKLYSPLIEPGSVDNHRLEPIIPATAGAIITSPDDTTDLTRAILALADPNTRQQCAAATSLLHQHISMEAHVKQLEQLLLKLATNNKKSTPTPTPTPEHAPEQTPTPEPTAEPTTSTSAPTDPTNPTDPNLHTQNEDDIISISPR